MKDADTISSESFLYCNKIAAYFNISLTYRIYMCYVVHKVSFAQINRDLQKKNKKKHKNKVMHKLTVKLLSLYVPFHKM